MWEDDCSWNKVTSSMETLLDGLGASVHSSSSLLSPSSSSSSDFSSSEPISPMSCLSTGSPYSLSSSSSSTSGSISPDTCSPGLLCDYDNASDIFQRGFYFGGGQSGSIWGSSSSGGVLPALHEWRKFDLQQKANSSTLRFIFPEPIIPNLKEEQISSSDSGDEGVVTGLGTTSLSSLVDRRGGDLTCPVSSTTSVATSPPKSNQRSGRESSLTSSRSSSSKLSLFAVGQRAEKFMKSFTTTSSSSSSLLATHPLLSGRPFQCQWIDCKASFSQKTCLIEHIDRTHIQTRKDDFSCFWHGCVRRNRPFNARYKLLIHMRVHTGHKPNKCMIAGCDKAFSRLENLKIHHRSHTGERPYICPHCPKAFSNSSDRAKHQRTHFDSKPYACIYPNCTKRYTDPSSLRKHAKMHYLPMKSTVKKESSSQRGNNATTTFSARNRRKYNNASCGGGGGGGGVVVPGSLSPVLLSSPALESKSNSESAIIISQTSLEREKCQLLNGNVDPPLNQLVSYSSSSHEPFPLITPQVAKVEQSEAGAGTTDLDGISLGELDWMQGINFDENFDIDYLL